MSDGRIKFDNLSLFGYSKDVPRVSPVRRCGFVAAVPEMADPLGFCLVRCLIYLSLVIGAFDASGITTVPQFTDNEIIDLQ